MSRVQAIESEALRPTRIPISISVAQKGVVTRLEARMEYANRGYLAYDFRSYICARLT